MINLYFDPKDKMYYYNALNKPCDSCNSLIEGTIIIRVFWDKLGSGVNYLCRKCKDNLKKSDNATVTETYVAIIDLDIPHKAIPVMFTKPTLECASNMMTCDVANVNLNGEKVIDKTFYSGRVDPKVKEYLIEAEDDNIALHLEHQAMNDKDLDDFFTSVKAAIPVLEHKDTEMLE